MTLRNMGGCPCPRCRMPLSEMHLMGREDDTKKRNRLARVDDVERRNRVFEAHKHIYEDGKPLDGNDVEELLKQDSLVPTIVCAPFRLVINAADICLERVLGSLSVAGTGLLPNFYRRSHARVRAGRLEEASYSPVTTLGISWSNFPARS